MADTLLNSIFRQELAKVAARYENNLRRTLERRGINATNNLSNSIKSRVIIKSSSDFRIDLFWNNYGSILNEGAFDLGNINDAGFRRLQTWVETKLGVPRYIKGVRGKRIYNSRKVVFKILRSWKKRRFPSKESRGIGWASVSLRSREAAVTKTVLQEALSTSYNRYLTLKIREQNKRQRRRR